MIRYFPQTLLVLLLVHDGFAYGFVPMPRATRGQSPLSILDGRRRTELLRAHIGDESPSENIVFDDDRHRDGGKLSRDLQGNDPSFGSELEFRHELRPMQGPALDSFNTFKTKATTLLMKDWKTDAYELAVQKNLPKKKNVSLHSVISSMSAMGAFVLLLPTLRPGFDDLGLPKIFEYEFASTDLLWQCQLVALLQMVSSIMGVFRLPKRSPTVRAVGFVTSALIVTQLSLVAISSLNGTDVYLFDAFSIQGRVLISVINTTLLKGSLDSLTLIIGDKDHKGWESVPGYNNKPAAFFTVFPFHVLICITGNAVLPVLSDKQSFLENALPFFGIFPGVQTLGYVSISLAVGLGALLATLQFEKKISPNTGSILSNVFLLLLTYDSIKFMYLLQAVPNRFPHSEYFTVYTPHLQSIWHTNEILGAATLLALAIGLRDFSSSKGVVSPLSTRASTTVVKAEQRLPIEASSASARLPSPESVGDLLDPSHQYKSILGVPEAFSYKVVIDKLEREEGV